MDLIRAFEKDISVSNLTSRTGGTVLNTPVGDNAINKNDTIEGSTVFNKYGDEDRIVAKFISVVGD